jgi:hypothetical protein
LRGATPHLFDFFLSLSLRRTTWHFQRLNPERSLSRLKAGRGLSSSPQAAPNLDLLPSILSTTRHALAFPIWWLVAFTIKHNCWHWPTWRVVRDIIKPMTAMTRCRFAELPEFRDIVGEAQARRSPLGSAALLCNAHRRFRPPPPPQSFGSHCWGAEWGLLVAALADGADPNRRVWIDVRRPR